VIVFSHIAAYKFVDIDDPATLREHLLSTCKSLSLKGSIVLASEGINLYLSGLPANTDGFLAELRSDARFRNIDVKTTTSTIVTYKRMLAKVKPEIITFRAGGIRPHDLRAPSVSASDLKRWLDVGHDDDGREIVMLDTRNQFEVDAGTFHNAESLGIEKFSQLPAAAAPVIERWHNKTVVTFCTGGIRCEKAAIYLEEQGLPHVLQLDGGILRYFEHEKDAHWEGELFVFDKRGELAPDLTHQ
jgi:UPF0176 protein